MSRQLHKQLALLLIGITVLTGCHPTRPFYFHDDGDLSHYLDKATSIEYPDVCTTSLAETTESRAPLTLTDPEFDEMWDLTLEECVSIALQNSKVVRTLGGLTPIGFADSLAGRTAGAPTVYDPAIMETSPSGTATAGPLVQRVTAGQAGGVESALADFDAQVRITGSQPGGAILNRSDRTLNRLIPGAEEAFPSVSNRYDGGLRTDLTKKTATGARFSVANVTDYGRWAGEGLGGQATRSSWTTALEVRWDQPLLRGRGTMINRIPIVLARINTDISLSVFESSVRNMVLDVERTYWDLHLAYRSLETAKIGRDSAHVLWKQVYEKRLEGVAPKQEEAQVREQYFSFRASVEQSLRDLYDQEARLRWLMGLAAADGRFIRPIDEPTMARVDFCWNSIRTETLVRSPELRQKKWQIKQRELELISAKNQLLPQLDVGVLYRWVGTGDDLFGSHDPETPGILAGTSAVRQLADGDHQEAGFFFNFAMPVGFRSALAGVRNAQLQLVREKAQLEDTELNEIHLLNQVVRHLDANYILAETHFNRWAAAEVEVEAAEAQFQFGRVTLDLVLEAQRRRAQAHVDYYIALIEYNKSLADIHYRKGSLLEYNGIQLAEGPWPTKAYWDAESRARERDASYYLDYGFTRPGVVSRGPVAAPVAAAPVEGPVDTYLNDMTIQRPQRLEEVPVPGPAPAEPSREPEELPPLESLGPVTQLRGAAPTQPSGVVRAAAEVENPLRSGAANFESPLHARPVGTGVIPAGHQQDADD